MVKKRNVCTITQQRWTLQQQKLLRENHGKMSVEELAELTGRTKESVRNRINYEKTLGTI